MMHAVFGSKIYDIPCFIIQRTILSEVWYVSHHVKHSVKERTLGTEQLVNLGLNHSSPIILQKYMRWVFGIRYLQRRLPRKDPVFLLVT